MRIEWICKKGPLSILTKKNEAVSKGQPLLFGCTLWHVSFFQYFFSTLDCNGFDFECFIYLAFKSPCFALCCGFFPQIMGDCDQSELNFDFFERTESEPLEVVVVFNVAKYWFNVAGSLFSVGDAFF
jgi:hypothetical protein